MHSLKMLLHSGVRMFVHLCLRAKHAMSKDGIYNADRIELNVSRNCSVEAYQAITNPTYLRFGVWPLDLTRPVLLTLCVKPHN